MFVGWKKRSGRVNMLCQETPKDSNRVASFPVAQGAVGKHRVLMNSAYQEHIEIDNRITTKEVHVKDT